MKILVTGCGLLGTAIRNVCSNYDHTFIFPERFQWDLTNSKKSRLLIEAYKPEVIIHTAAKVGGIKLNTDKPEDMFYENIAMTSNLIHFAARSGVKKFVAFGSTCAFNPLLEKIDEHVIQHGSPYVSNSAYGYAKRMAEVHLKAAKQQHGMDYAYYVPCSMYGEEDNFNLDDAHVIPSLIHKCYLADKELKVWGDGTPIRELLFAEDLANIVIKLIDKEVGSLLVGSGEEVSIKEMVDTIISNMEFSGSIVWDTEKPNGQLRRAESNTTKFKKLLPEFVFTPFAQGIKRTIEWFEKNYPNIRL